MPHPGGEKGKMTQFRLDFSLDRQVDPKNVVWLTQREPAGIFGFTRRVRGECDVQCRTDPALRMNMVRMPSARAQSDRPATRKTDPAVTPLRKQRMSWIRRRKLPDITLDGLDDRLPQLTDYGIDPAEKGPVGLRSSPNGLIEIFRLGDVKFAKGRSELGQRR